VRDVPVMTFDELAQKYCARQINTPEELRKTLLAQKERYQPLGWVLLECANFNSSKFGDLWILPYGPNNTYKSIPDHPISQRGLASDMSTVVGNLPAEVLS
jgi:hypothetical protein